MKRQHPVLAYVEGDEASIAVMKIMVERVMQLRTLHVLQNGADFFGAVEATHTEAGPFSI